jgi:TorA maturation chaperone TorD
VQDRAAELDEIEVPRARAYALLAALLARPPAPDLLEGIAALKGDGTSWGQALMTLAAVAGGVAPAEAEREFNRLFIGLQRGELMPYASYYLTGFLQDRPLVDLRGDMARLGIARSPGVAEPEDHIAGILEMMAGLIDGRFGAPATASAQQAFFERHLARWAPRFFRDLERAQNARLYRPVGALGRLLLEIEQNAFALAD